MESNAEVRAIRTRAIELEFDLYKSFNLTRNGSPWVPSTDQIGKYAHVIEKYVREGIDDNQT